MYNTVGKRDILIFPKFDNIGLIQEVRKTHDRLADLIPPHITLAFPFSASMSDDELISQLSILLKKYSPFNVTFKGVSLSDDNYIFLDCIDGYEKIINLHDDIYNDIIPEHLNAFIRYIPHITLGQAEDIDDLKDFCYEFSTVVDEVSIEFVGEHEESTIVASIKLN